MKIFEWCEINPCQTPVLITFIFINQLYEIWCIIPQIMYYYRQIEYYLLSKTIDNLVVDFCVQHFYFDEIWCTCTKNDFLFVHNCTEPKKRKNNSFL